LPIASIADGKRSECAAIKSPLLVVLKIAKDFYNCPHSKSKMTPFKAPSQVKFLKGLPKSLVGKVLKKELRKLNFT
jgi:non-ribosomal peptide synthetase component E (peptide arylation enzyme)